MTRCRGHKFDLARSWRFPLLPGVSCGAAHRFLSASYCVSYGLLGVLYCGFYGIRGVSYGSLGGSNGVTHGFLGVSNGVLSVSYGARCFQRLPGVSYSVS